MLLTILTISSLSSITLFLGYKTLKNTKELKELKIKHRITMEFADKLSKKLLYLEKANKKAHSNGTAKAGENGLFKNSSHKKTRRSKKKSNPNTANSGSSK